MISSQFECGLFIKYVFRKFKITIYKFDSTYALEQELIEYLIIKLVNSSLFAILINYFYT